MWLENNIGKCVVGCVILVIGAIFTFLFAGPYYSVWQQGMTGKARLQRAEQEKRILIETARAEVEAAALQKEAIELVGQAARSFPEYRQQQFILAFAEALQEGNIHQIVYVPTEASIPITEAGKR